MSKLAILLCAMLFASTANSLFLSGALKTVQNNVDQIVSGAISEVKQKTETAQGNAQELGRKLFDESIKLGEKIQDEIKNVLQKAEDDVNKLAAQAEGLDITECTELTTNLDYNAVAVFSNVSTCIADKLETGSGYMESIIKVSADVVANLTGIREEAHHCGDNVDGIKSSGAAIVCANLAVAKATWVSTKAVPEMAIKTTKLNILLATLAPSLADCKVTNGLVTFHQETSNIVERTKNCIQRKIDESQSSTSPKIDHTTEMFTPRTEFFTSKVTATPTMYTTEQVSTAV